MMSAAYAPNTEMWLLVNNRMRATNAVFSTPLIEASKSSEQDQHHKTSYMALPFFLFWQYPTLAPSRIFSNRYASGYESYIKFIT